MSYLIHFFISCLIGTLSLSTMSVNFAIAGEGENTIILTSSFADTCSTNFQCEQKGEDTYVCHSHPETFSGTNTTVQYIPLGKSSVDAHTYGSICSYESIAYWSEKEILYTGPDTYLYPFVRITKIQV